MSFSDSILTIRAKLNISQEQFAREFGVAYQTVNRWENGHTYPSKKTLVRIRYYCKTRDIPFDWVI